MTAAAKKKIDLIFHGRYEEAEVAVAFKPGHLLKKNSAGTIQKHSTFGRRGLVMVALHDHMQGYQGNPGRQLWDALVVGEQAPYALPIPGDVMAIRVPANAPAIVIGDLLTPDGAGCLVKATVESAETISVNAAPSTAVSNTVNTEQDYDVTYSLPANTLKVGDILNIKGHVIVSAQSGTDTLTVKVYLGSQVLVTTAAVDAAAGDIVEFDLNVVVRTIGNAGTFVMFGTNGNGVPGTVTMKACHLGSTAIDTTAAKTIKVSSTWSATSATNTSALQSLVVSLNRSTSGEPIAQAEEALDNSANADEDLIAARIL